MWTRSFWAAALERAVKAFAATLASVFFVGGAALDIRGIDWGNALGVAGGAAVASLIFSIVGSNVGPKGSPSLVADPAAAGVPDPAAGERLAERSNVKVGGFTGSGQPGYLPPPTTRATGTVRLGDAGASTAPPD